MKPLFIFLTALITISCSNLNNSGKKFSNKGIVNILNGRGKIDTLKYSCDSCSEILNDKSVFDTIISIASKEAKDNLRNKLSFRPMSIDIRLLRRDSLFYTTGKKIDSLVIVLAKYKSIGQNGYGTEGEVETTSIIYLLNNRVTDLEGKIKKDSLSFIGDVISRSLTLYDDEGTLYIQPIKLKNIVHLIVKTDESCLEDARLKIAFTDDTAIEVVSWNKFNCDNTSYFKLTETDLNLLKSKPISFISFSEDKYILCSVPENEKDYFMQYVSLIQNSH